MKGNGYDKNQNCSDKTSPRVHSHTPSSGKSETSPLVELYLTRTFLHDVSEVLGKPVTADDPEVNEFVQECVVHDHLSEKVNPEIRVLRFGELNELAVYYSRVTSVVRFNGERIFFRKYIFVKASTGQKWVDRNSSKLKDLGRVLTKILMTGFVLNRAHAAFEKIKDLARSMTMTE